MSWYISTLLILINLALLPATAYWNMAMHFHLANFYIMSIHVHARYLLVLYNETGRTKPSENVPRHQKKFCRTIGDGCLWFIIPEGGKNASTGGPKRPSWDDLSGWKFLEAAEWGKKKNHRCYPILSAPWEALEPSSIYASPLAGTFTPPPLSLTLLPPLRPPSLRETFLEDVLCPVPSAVAAADGRATLWRELRPCWRT
jgi:hypothetical protein